MPVIDLHRFDAGLNLRDSLDQVQPNETPDALNATLTTRAAVRPRNGCTQAASLPAGVVKFVYYSIVLNKWFVQVDSTLYVRAGDLSGSWTSHITLGTTNRVAMVDFAGVAVVTVIGGSQGVWTTDGTTATARSAVAMGSAISLFKNRVWLLDSLLNRLWFSNVGTPNTYTTATDFVAIKEKDDEPLTAFGASGAGLLVFKKRSAYRITDASTGAYQTIDWTSGCVGAQASASLRGIAYTWAPDGLYAWDGVGRGVSIGDKLRPRFLENAASEATIANVAAGATSDRVFFAYPVDGSANSRWLELRPADVVKADAPPASAWIMEHELAQAGVREIVSFAVKGTTLYGALNDADVLFSLLDASPGADNGVTFVSRYKTPPLGLGKLARLHRLRVYGSSAAAATSTKEIRTYKNWESAIADSFNVTALLNSADGEERVDLNALGHADAFQLEFRTSGGTGKAELDRLLLDLVPLER